jgi:hypothetical protein
MKRDLPNDPDLPNDRMAGDEAFARQLAALSAQLREDGVAPASDLWPAIERSLGAPAVAARGRWPAGRGRAWAGAALAATVLLAVGLGVDALRHSVSGSRDGAANPAAAAPPAATAAAAPGPGQGLRAVEAAYDELRAALERSPDDPELSRLVLLIHHTRGRLLRLQADDGARGALRGRG